jgi:hypothetical protein
LAEFAAGHAQNQYRRRACPALIKTDQRRENLLIRRGIAETDEKAPGLLVVGGGSPVGGLEDFLEIGGAHVAVGKGARAPAGEYRRKDTIDGGSLLQLMDFESREGHGGTP